MTDDYVVVDSRNVKQIGGSLYVNLPANLLKDLDVSPGDSVSFVKHETTGVISVVKTDKLKVEVPGIGKAKMRFSIADLIKALRQTEDTTDE